MVAQRTTLAARADFLLCVLLLHGGKTDSDLARAHQVELKLDETTNFFVPPSTYPLSHQVLRSLTGEDVQFYHV